MVLLQFFIITDRFLNHFFKIPYTVITTSVYVANLWIIYHWFGTEVVQWWRLSIHM